MRPLAATALVWTLVAAGTVVAFSGKVDEMRAASGRVRAAIEILDPFGAAQRAILERGGTLHVRVEAVIWEDRPVFDRAVAPPTITAFRIVRKPDGSVLAIVSSAGRLATYKPYPERLRLDIDACALQQLVAGPKYYLDAAVTIGRLGAEELDEANEAVFGGDEDPAGLKRVGKFLLNSVLQIKDYVDSVSTEVRSGRFTKAGLKD